MRLLRQVKAFITTLLQLEQLRERIMKGLAGVAGLLLAASVLSGCSSDYVMATKDGQMIMTEGKPSIDKETGLVEYTDRQGHVMQINGDEVSTIIER
jgi:ABC-type enterochelin transport system ATPase subunit